VVSGALVVARIVSAVLDLIAMKPIAIFVWWLPNRANRIDFQERAELRRRVEAASRGGRPVLFASNHLSMFDDPVLPMALYRMGSRADRRAGSRPDTSSRRAGPSANSIGKEAMGEIRTCNPSQTLCGLG
jgi:hypothetical protein